MEITIIIGFYIIVLLYSIILHEISHAVMALWLGDTTAKDLGRITLDPVRHIDLFGSIIVPLLMIFTSGIAFGWAKPVPYNPNNLRNKKWGDVLVAFAGPFMNFLLALVSAIVAVFIPISQSIKETIIFNLVRGDWSHLTENIIGSVPAIIFTIFAMAIFWNVLLGIFNLIPIPPLDGSKLLYKFVNLDIKVKIFLEQWGIFIIFVLLMIPMFGFWLNFVLGTVLEVFFGVALL